VNAADLETIGIWLLVGAVVLIGFEVVLAAVWSLRLGRKARVLSSRLASEQAHLRADVERLRASLVEMQELWQPYRRLLRLLRHPLTIALMQSYARRRAAVR
jgi:hypothetical protein